jgi:hypothetical protein
MTISLYAASIPVFKQMLNSVSGVLAKAEAHCVAKSIDPNALLQAGRCKSRALDGKRLEANVGWS